MAHPCPNLRGRNDPAEMPLYFLAEAAHHLALPRTTVRAWALGREYPTGNGTGVGCPVLALAGPEEPLLSFLNLVELHVLSSLRRAHRFRLRHVRSALAFLRKQFHSEHPLIARPMFADGKNLFLARYGELANLSPPAQRKMADMLQVSLNRIERDSHDTPIRLFPFTRSHRERSPRLVAIDPRVGFGKPCIAGTGIPTSIIAERHEAGDSIPLLAKDYGRSQKEIAEALRYESRVAS